jgi:hypothetical protein
LLLALASIVVLGSESHTTHGYILLSDGSGSLLTMGFVNLTTFPVFFYIYRLYGLVVRVPGYRSRGPGFDSRHYQIFLEVVGLERGSLSLVRIIEELLERKVAAPV